MGLARKDMVHRYSLVTTPAVSGAERGEQQCKGRWVTRVWRAHRAPRGAGRQEMALQGLAGTQRGSSSLGFTQQPRPAERRLAGGSVRARAEAVPLSSLLLTHFTLQCCSYRGKYRTNEEMRSLSSPS